MWGNNRHPQVLNEKVSTALVWSGQVTHYNWDSCSYLLVEEWLRSGNENRWPKDWLFLLNVLCLINKSLPLCSSLSLSVCHMILVLWTWNLLGEGESCSTAHITPCCLIPDCFTHLFYIPGHRKYLNLTQLKWTTNPKVWSMEC